MQRILRPLSNDRSPISSSRHLTLIQEAKKAQLRSAAL